MEILKGRGFHNYGILRAWGGGGNAFWNFRRQGGLKHGSRPWLGMDIFWNCPMKNHRGESVGEFSFRAALWFRRPVILFTRSFLNFNSTFLLFHRQV